MNLPLALSLLLSGYPADPPTFDSLPAPGTLLRVVSTYWRTEPLMAMSSDTTWIERGEGTGIRTTRRHWGPVYVEDRHVVGFVNGQPFPDLERVTVTDDSGLVSRCTRRRRQIPEGDVWSLDSSDQSACPNRVIEFPTAYVRKDSLGREVVRRTHDGFERLEVHETVWGLEGVTVKVHKLFSSPNRDGSTWETLVHPDRDPGCTDSCGRLLHERRDSTVWRNGQVAQSIECTTHFNSPELGNWPTCVSSTWKNGRIISKVSGRDPDLSSEKAFWSWSLIGDSLGVGSGYTGYWDTTRFSVDAEGATLVHETRSNGVVNIEERDTEGHVLRKIHVYNGSRTGDSAIWETGRLVRLVRLLPYSPEIFDYDYAVLDAASRAHRQPGRTELRIRRNGDHLRWTGQIPDGAVVQLFTLGGRRVAGGVFLEGHASVGLPAGSTPLLWSVRHSDRTLDHGSVPPR